MTPFMSRVQEALDGRVAEVPGTEQARPTSVAAGTDGQVQARSLAEQLVAEANSVLPAHGPAIELRDVPGPGGLAFTLVYGDRSATVETVVAEGCAVARLVAPGLPDGSRRLADAQEVESLLLTLIAGRPAATPH